MSYVWLPIDANLYGNHKTARLCRYLGCSRAVAVGHLVVLWSWATVHAPDGDLSRLEPEDVATVADWQGDLEAFLPALVRAGFVDKNRTLHDWEEHQGANFRKRLSEAERKRRQRDKDGTDVGQVCDKDGTEDDDRTGQDRTGEEEGKEEALLRVALTELPESESNADDYRRTLERYQGKLSEEHIERIIFQLAGWKPKKPRAKLHLTLAQWLSKEEPDPPPNKDDDPQYPDVVAPVDW
jgi:hypothetical protein